jgi:DnaJ-class molecular chaperone
VGIRQAYLAQSLRYHPDRNSAQNATGIFQDIANAYAILSDQDQRTLYDNTHVVVIPDSIRLYSTFHNI